MSTEKYTIRDICLRFNLSNKHVKQLIREARLQSSNPAQKPMSFSHDEVVRLRQEILAKRLVSMKIIAEASEEIGLYDDDFGDYERR